MQNVENLTLNYFKESVKRRLNDIFIQNWYSQIENESVYTNYRMFKKEFGPDPYLTKLPFDCITTMLKFKVLNNNLPVNQLRLENIPRYERTCNKCSTGDIADEFHYLFQCPFLAHERSLYIPKFYSNKPSSEKFCMLLNSNRKTLLLKLKRFIVAIQQKL